MINQYVNISLKDPKLGQIKYFSTSETSFFLGYPCTDKNKCTPYVLELQRGKYLFECWGSVGGIWEVNNRQSTPGYGGYTSGEIFIGSKTILYVYIGNTGFYNALKEFENEIPNIVYAPPGGATDVRLVATDKWWDTQSLVSRIMVAAGGGGAEWGASIGGNGEIDTIEIKL